MNLNVDHYLQDFENTTFRIWQDFQAGIASNLDSNFQYYWTLLILWCICVLIAAGFQIYVKLLRA